MNAHPSSSAHSFNVETALARALEPLGFEPQELDYGVDLYDPTRRIAIQCQASTLGARDLRAQLVHLAVMLGAMPHVSRGVLVTRLRNIRPERLQSEWAQLRGVLRPDIAERIDIVALEENGHLVSLASSEDDGLLATLGQAVEVAFSSHQRRESASASWTPKTFRVWLVLLNAWLHGEKPLSIGTIAEAAACSSPTVTAALGRLADHGEVERSSSRGAAFKGMPRKSLDEILVLAPTLRPTRRYIDASGRPPDMDWLFRRVEKLALANVAVGGVVAARHFDPTFDLNGIPRLDLSLHGVEQLGWLEQVDPGLREAKPGDGKPALVVHHIASKGPRFETSNSSGVAIACPAETLLDLYDLRLTGQAQQLVRVLRGRSS